MADNTAGQDEIVPESEEEKNDKEAIPAPPADDVEKQFIDKLAALVVTHGNHVEEQAKQTQGENPKFQFVQFQF